VQGRLQAQADESCSFVRSCNNCRDAGTHTWASTLYNKARCTALIMSHMGSALPTPALIQSPLMNFLPLAHVLTLYNKGRMELNMHLALCFVANWVRQQFNSIQPRQYLSLSPFWLTADTLPASTPPNSVRFMVKLMSKGLRLCMGTMHFRRVCEWGCTGPGISCGPQCTT